MADNTMSAGEKDKLADYIICAAQEDVDDDFLCSLAAYGTDTIHRILTTHHSADVRASVATWTTNEEIHQQLATDEDELVREAVAKHSMEDVQWQLIDDDYYEVRAVVAQYGTDDMRARLVDDDNSSVRAAVARHGTDDMRRKLINDDSDAVRRAIAMNGTEEMEKQLINDKHHAIFRIALSCINDTDFLRAAEKHCDSDREIYINRRIDILNGDDAQE